MAADIYTRVIVSIVTALISIPFAMIMLAALWLLWAIVSKHF
jgi:hypothetical protein